ncbi:MAG TPA: hypothetical protein VKG84_11185 [Candidatus Acidoferrales bacterium]|nr:hypothetical protein [Candidatus Acidoferrales bacterium]
MAASVPHASGPPHRERFRRLPAIVLGLYALAALAGCGGMDSSQVQPVPHLEAEVVLCNSSMANCTSQESFSVQVVRDLNVMVNWQNLPAGTHTQRVSFVLPSGDFYKAYEKSFAVEDGSNGALTTVQALPVAGTWITQRRLTGAWTVSLELDGQALSTQTFQLTP